MMERSNWGNLPEVMKLAQFVVSSRFEELSSVQLAQLKIRILDTLGVAFGALGAEPIRKIRDNLDDFGGNALCTLIGGGATAPDRAAFYNGALVRYLDFMDSYLAPGETFHPSDNLAAVLASAEYADVDGKTFLIALAVAYEVQARLSMAAPVRAKGFDHTTQGAYAAAAGTSRALRLNAVETANAIAMSGTANNALRVTRTGKLSHWKGLAYPNMAASATHLAFLARHGITGPMEVFEGNKGFKQSIAGAFEVDWSEKSFHAIERSIVKKYNAEIHSQSTIEGVLELRSRYAIRAADIDKVDVAIFQVAYDIIGGGEEGDKRKIETKEEADHSLPYMVAVALLDGELNPEQYRIERVLQEDVQTLLRRVEVNPAPQLTALFPKAMPSYITITMKSGKKWEIKKYDYEGFYTRPMSWKTVSEKFYRLSQNFLPVKVLKIIESLVLHLEEIKIRDLTSHLSGEGEEYGGTQIA